MTTDVVGAFVWRSSGAGRVLVCKPLEMLAPHAFTTCDLSFRGASANDDWRRLGSLFGLQPDLVTHVVQVHGRAIVVIRPGDSIAADVRADAIVSFDPERAVSVRTADCVPILMADRARRVVAAVHAGWRGTAAGAVRAAIDVIVDAGIAAADLVAALGPSIGPCCYQVGDDTRTAFLGVTPDAAAWFTADGPGRWKLDLWRANRDQLEASGVDPAAIHVSGWCTADHPSECFSYRRDGEGTGRLVAAIRLKAGNS